MQRAGVGNRDDRADAASRGSGVGATAGRAAMPRAAVATVGRASQRGGMSGRENERLRDGAVAVPGWATSCCGEVGGVGGGEGA